MTKKENNRLLQILMGMVDSPVLSTYHTKKTQTNHGRSDIVRVDGINQMIKQDYLSEDFGYPDFAELFVNAYVNELLGNLSLERGESKSGPHPTWHDNWRYERHLKPEVLIEGDFDLQKSYLQMNILTPLQSDIGDVILSQTGLFMEKIGILKIEAPK